jgi:hypothetical protein
VLHIEHTTDAVDRLDRLRVLLDRRPGRGRQAASESGIDAALM